MKEQVLRSLIEDARAFKRRHEKTFRLLSGREGSGAEELRRRDREKRRRDRRGADHEA